MDVSKNEFLVGPSQGKRKAPHTHPLASTSIPSTLSLSKNCERHPHCWTGGDRGKGDGTYFRYAVRSLTRAMAGALVALTMRVIAAASHQSNWILAKS